MGSRVVTVLVCAMGIREIIGAGSGRAISAKLPQPGLSKHADEGYAAVSWTTGIGCTSTLVNGVAGIRAKADLIRWMSRRRSNPEMTYPR